MSEQELEDIRIEHETAIPLAIIEAIKAKLQAIKVQNNGKEE